MIEKIIPYLAGFDGWEEIKRIADSKTARKINKIVSPRLLRLITFGKYSISDNFFERLFFGPFPREFRSFNELLKITRNGKRIYHHNSQILVQERKREIVYFIPLHIFEMRKMFFDEAYKNKKEDPFEAFPGTRDFVEYVLEKYVRIGKKYDEEYEKLLREYRRDEWTKKNWKNAYNNLTRDFVKENLKPEELEEKVKKYNNIDIQFRKKDIGWWDLYFFTDILYHSKEESFEKGKDKVDKVGNKYIVQRSILGSCFA